MHTALRTVALMTLFFATAAPLHAEDLVNWQPLPLEWTGAKVTAEQAVLQHDKWAFLLRPKMETDVAVFATVTINEPAKQFRFFGESWSVWPDHTYGDQGFDAGILLRSGTRDGHPKQFGYRVQLSHKYQEVALVRFPDGGYVRSVPCPVAAQKPIKLEVTLRGNLVQVSVDGHERIRYADLIEPTLPAGQVGVGVSSAAKVTWAAVSVQTLVAATPANPETTARVPHQPHFRMRKWIGGRPWVFDGDEPILLLPAPESSTINNAKLKPGYKPQLSWNSHWDTQNQGAYAEATNHTADVSVNGGGESLVASWIGKHVKDKFATKSSLTVRFDRDRQTYVYETDTELTVGSEPFHFRYGYDFEHHTPLDPFNWQYLVAKKRGGALYHRPVYPIDPGPQNDLEPYHGLRVWYGRHNERPQVAPAVEYLIDPEWNRDPRDLVKPLLRPLNTAVCAAFYDTGVSFGAETAAPGTKVRVKYRYTGFPADEAERLFRSSQIYESPTLDPHHHYIFADEWPKLTFSKFVPLSETWIYGRTPFRTGHNVRPNYELEKNCGAGSGFAMKLGPASFAKANLPVPQPFAAGRYVVTALIKSINAHGPGGRMELEATQAKTNKVLAATKHFVGNGSFDWQRQGFVFEVPNDAAALAIAFGNAGTGEMLITDVEFQRLADGAATPTGILAKANEQPPTFATAPANAIFDLRMQEGRGLHVLNYAGGPHLDLANLEWVTDSGRAALRFADNTTGRKDYRRDSSLARSYLEHPSYADKQHLPVAIAGLHGGGQVLKGLTLAAWIKPAAEMGHSAHGNKGDIIGYGARRFILSLHGSKAPYQLAARLNVNDTFVSETKLAADRWYHVAMTAEPEAGQWRMRLFVDGKEVAAGITKKFAADGVVPNSLILGAEIFYLHDAYYRGLIGPVLVLDRALAEPEIANAAQSR